MKGIFLVLALFISNSCLAEVISMEVGGQGYFILFDFYPTKMIDRVETEGKFYFVGSSGRYNMSLTVEDPLCKGGVSVKENYLCFSRRVKKSPGFLKDHYIKLSVPYGIQVLYVTDVTVGGESVRVVNSHVLFSRDGKWGDLHVSVVRPNGDEMRSLFLLGKHLVFAS